MKNQATAFRESNRSASLAQCGAIVRIGSGHHRFLYLLLLCRDSCAALGVHPHQFEAVSETSGRV